jgi:SAM-dependent methyltransferase
MEKYRELSFCRICGGQFYDATIKLKDSPLANELYLTEADAINADLFPLVVVQCQACKHIQLKHIVDPERLFLNYVYASGTSETFRNHFNELASRLSSLMPGGLVLEVGSNDGTLLEALTQKGMRAIGVEPSQKLAEMSKEKCEAVYAGFLNKDLSKILLDEYGEFDFVVGNNVFAHIDDLVGAFKAAEKILKPNGTLVFEVAHALKLVELNLFDTIYHEHMSYHTVISLEIFMRKFGFLITEVEEINMHGGSIRVFCEKKSLREDLPIKVQEIASREVLAGLENANWMASFNAHLGQLYLETKNAINAEPPNTIWFGYGAPAKAVTFINEFGLEQLGLIGIIDDNAGKQGKYLPASGIKVVSQTEMESSLIPNLKPMPINCVIFPWNLSNEITVKLKSLSKHALKIVWFLPSYREVEIKK